MYTRSSLFSVVYADIESRGACEEANFYFGGQIQVMPSMTFGDGIDSMNNIVVQGHPNVQEKWAAWVYSVMCEDFDEQVRLDFLSMINDPMIAFSIYIYVASLTTAEDELLENIFTGFLPKAEWELSQGIITRAKYS